MARSLMVKSFMPAFILIASQFGSMNVHAEQILQSFSPQSLQQIKAAHAGQAFVVFLWSLDCTYCQASMEALAAVQVMRPLKVITVATAPAGNKENRRHIDGKLAATGLKSQRWAFGPYPEAQLRYAVDPKWRGERPRTYWFGKAGRAVAYSGVLDAATIRKYMAE